jgi:hypothetical protein
VRRFNHQHTWRRIYDFMSVEACLQLSGSSSCQQTQGRNLYATVSSHISVSSWDGLW